MFVRNFFIPLHRKMKKKKMILVCAMMLSMAVHAQWRVGVTAGTDYNLYTMDKQYETDWQTEGRWGATVGITGQYNVTDWLGVRADLNWTQKNYRHNRERLPIDYKYFNNYLQLPVMASLSMGGEKLRGFVNLGVYGGYWLSSHLEHVLRKILLVQREGGIRQRPRPALGLWSGRWRRLGIPLCQTLGCPSGGSLLPQHDERPEAVYESERLSL